MKPFRDSPEGNRGGHDPKRLVHGTRDRQQLGGNPGVATPTGVGEQNEIKYQLRIDPMTPRNPLGVVLGVIVGVTTPSEGFIKKGIDG